MLASQWPSWISCCWSVVAAVSFPPDLGASHQAQLWSLRYRLVNILLWILKYFHQCGGNPPVSSTSTFAMRCKLYPYEHHWVSKFSLEERKFRHLLKGEIMKCHILTYLVRRLSYFWHKNSSCTLLKSQSRKAVTWELHLIYTLVFMIWSTVKIMLKKFWLKLTKEHTEREAQSPTIPTPYFSA